MAGYSPLTAKQRQAMLDTLGYASIDELFAVIPPEARRQTPPDLPEGRAELAVWRAMQEKAAQNHVFASVFRGAGAYRHYIPAIVKAVAAKEELLTAYTPYQPEISQGILQAIFEYQSQICLLTGMDAANASVYDGAHAAAEAAGMCRDRKRTKTLISEAVHPHIIAAVQTYCEAADVPWALVPRKDGVTDETALSALLDDETAGVLVQSPNFYGLIEDGASLAAAVHNKGGKLIMSGHPMAWALLKSPGECGADIAVGDGQPLGLPLGFGGPYVGYMACTQALVRRMPGRIVGQTKDLDGKRAFVLTLQAREQHIRREKAVSSICSNQAHCALTVSAYLAAMGEKGLHDAASQCYAKAHYLAERMAEIDGFSLVYQGAFFHEFVTRTPVAADLLLAQLEKRDILGGYPLVNGEQILWCVTEMNTRQDMDACVAVLKEAGTW